MQTVKGVKVRCIKLLKNKVYKFARYITSLYSLQETRIKHRRNETHISFFIL